MSISADSLLKSANQVKDAFNSYIVRPINSFGLGGFVFDVEGDATVTLASEITDHYTENNTAIQDHIAVQPKRYVLTTFVGELVDRRDDSTNTPVQNMARKLNIVNSYLPVLTSGAQQLLNTINGTRDDVRFSGLVNDAANIYATIRNLNPPIPAQQRAYLYFKALQETKQLVSLQTPFEYMTNMVIEMVTAYQSEDTRFVSDFTITLKEIRFASTRRVSFEYIRQLDSVADVQRGEVANNGKSQGTDVPTSSILNDMYGKFF